MWTVISGQLADGQVEIIAEVIEPPQLIKSTQRIKLQTMDDRVVINVITGLYPQFAYADVIKVQGKIVKASLYFPKLELVEVGLDRGDIGVQLWRWIYSIRSGLLDLMGRVFVEPQATLVAGIVFGIEHPLDAQTQQIMQTGGLLHIVVASGYNVTIVISYLASLLKWFGRRVAVIGTLVGLLFYCLIAGLDPPIVRAAIMGVVTLGAIMASRQSHSLLGLLVIAMLMLIHNPLLYQSLSFQLTFLATVAILLFQPMVEGWLRLWPEIIREDLSTTVSVQLLTLPWIWWQIGRISPNSILVNALTLWAVPLVMLLSPVALFVGVFSLKLALIVASPVHYLIQYIIVVAHWLG